MKQPDRRASALGHDRHPITADRHYALKSAVASGMWRLRRRGREAEGGGLLNRYTAKSRIEGSNPSVSANFDGQSPGLAMVSIGGRPEALLRVQLKAFKSNSPPPGTTIMNRIAKGYTDEQLDALAKYYSQLPKGGK
jgi:cytochrome subunit of sulfide dehydrogenase